MSINENLWSAKLPNGDVRSGTLEQLTEAFRSGLIGESTLVRGARSDHWMTLAEVLRAAASGVTPAGVAAPATPVVSPPPVAAQPESPNNGSPELWQVKLASGEIRSGTRLQLEEAFRAGHLDGSLMALASGAREWVQLATIMGRSEPAAPSPVIPSVPPPASVAPPRAAVLAPATAATPPGSDELWQVKIAEGQVRSGTWEQLEEAVKAGHLDERMLVLAAGAHEWVTLGSVLNRHLSAPAPVVATAATPEEAEPVAAPQQASVIESEQEPEAPAQDAQGDSPSVWDEDRLWQVKLTGKQLEMAFHAGLLDKDALVQADGDDEPVRLGDIVRPQSVPPEPALAEESGHDGAATNGAAAQSEATGESLQE